jgi:hypothetical protein
MRTPSEDWNAGTVHGSLVLRLLLAVVLLVSLANCRGGSESAKAAGRAGKVWFLVPSSRDRVDRIVVADDKGRRSGVTRSGPVWTPDPGTVPVAASLMLESEAQVLPLGAYKRFESNPPDPSFGLDPPSMTVRIEGPDKTWTIAFGGKNFNGAGYYVKADGDPSVYLVPRRVGDDLWSMVVGNRVDTPRDPRETKAIESYNQDQEPDDVTNPWLHQALEVQPPGTDDSAPEPVK